MSARSWYVTRRDQPPTSLRHSRALVLQEDQRIMDKRDMAFGVACARRFLRARSQASVVHEAWGISTSGSRCGSVSIACVLTLLVTCCSPLRGCFPQRGAGSEMD